MSQTCWCKSCMKANEWENKTGPVGPVGLQVSYNISDVMVIVLKSTISPKKVSQQFNSALLSLIPNPHHEIWDNWPTFPLFFLLPAARTQPQLCKRGGKEIRARFNLFFCIEKLTQVRQHATCLEKSFFHLLSNAVCNSHGNWRRLRRRLWEGQRRCSSCYTTVSVCHRSILY